MLAHWQEVFLTALRRIGTISGAAKAANKDRTTVYHHRARNREFRRAIDRALTLHQESNVKRTISGTVSG